MTEPTQARRNFAALWLLCPTCSAPRPSWCTTSAGRRATRIHASRLRYTEKVMRMLRSGDVDGATLAVPCTHCAATEGTWCTTAGGRPESRFHENRRQAVRLIYYGLGRHDTKIAKSALVEITVLVPEKLPRKLR